MILVRQTFQAKFGKAGTVAAQMRESNEVISRTLGLNHHWRILTDLSGTFDTVVLEIEAESLGDWEQTRNAMFQNPEFLAAIAPGVELLETGSSQFFTIEAEG